MVTPLLSLATYSNDNIFGEEFSLIPYLCGQLWYV